MIKNHRTMSDLWRDSIYRMWRGEVGNGIDFVASVDTVSYDNLLAANSMDGAVMNKWPERQPEPRATSRCRWSQRSDHPPLGSR